MNDSRAVHHFIVQHVPACEFETHASLCHCNADFCLKGEICPMLLNTRATCCIVLLRRGWRTASMNGPSTLTTTEAHEALALFRDDAFMLHFDTNTSRFLVCTVEVREVSFGVAPVSLFWNFCCRAVDRDLDISADHPPADTQGRCFHELL